MMHGAEIACRLYRMPRSVPGARKPKTGAQA